MSFSKIEHYYSGRTGIHEKAISREDGKISDRYVQRISIVFPKIFQFYIQIIHWKIDDRIDIIAEDVLKNNLLTQLHNRTIICSPSKKNSERNIFQAASIAEHGFKSLSISQLSEINEENVNEYFQSNNIFVFKESTFHHTYEYFCSFLRNNTEQIIALYKIIIIAPLLKEKDKKLQPLIKKINYESRLNKVKKSIVLFLTISILLAGCFTMFTRKRVGCDCNDGSSSDATGSGACSHHDGVRSWTYEYWWDK